MKNFEKWWIEFEPQIDPNTYDTEIEVRKAIGRCCHRQAYESIKKELEYPTNLDGIDAFIDEELNE